MTEVKDEEWKMISHERIDRPDPQYWKFALRNFILPNGDHRPFNIAMEDPVSCVVAITEDNQALLTRQFRPGPLRVFTELVGGLVDPEETPVVAAERELLEETGYAFRELIHLVDSSDNPYTTRLFHFYLAYGCHKVAEQKLDPTESITVVTMPLQELRETYLDILRPAHAFAFAHALRVIDRKK